MTLPNITPTAPVLADVDGEVGARGLLFREPYSTSVVTRTLSAQQRARLGGRTLMMVARNCTVQYGWVRVGETTPVITYDGASTLASPQCEAAPSLNGARLERLPSNVDKITFIMGDEVADTSGFFECYVADNAVGVPKTLPGT